MSVSPEFIFDKFLRRMRGKLLEMPTRQLHRLFYFASLKHPTKMDSFEFLLRTEPYSPTLARLVWEFQQADQLGRMNPDYTGYVMKLEGPPLSSEDPDETDDIVETLVSLLRKDDPSPNMETA